MAHRKWPRSRSAPARVETKSKTVKRKQWSNKSMLAAMEMVKRGQSVLRAAKLHGVSRTTLQGRVKGKVVHGTTPGPKS